MPIDQTFPLHFFAISQGKYMPDLLFVIWGSSCFGMPQVLAVSMRFLVSNFIHRVSGQGSDKSMGGPKSYDVCHIFVHTGCLKNVTHRMLLKPKNPNQNWVLWGRIFSWTRLGSAWSRIVNSEKRPKNDFQGQNLPGLPVARGAGPAAFC